MSRIKFIITALMVSIQSITGLSASQDCKPKHCIPAKYDYIIVGNGTAGAVLARKLSDSNKKRVLVLEAGINHNNDPVVLDANALFPNLNTLTFDPVYADTQSVQVLNIPLQSTFISQGRGWGGGSTHNYLQVVRGTPGIYDLWAVAAGDNFWSYNNLLNYMKALENYTPFAGPVDLSERGVGGPISITQGAPITTDPLALLLAPKTNAGFIEDLNNPNDISTTGLHNVGFSSYQYYATPGPVSGSVVERSFSSKNFLTPSVVGVDGHGKNGRKLLIKSNSFASRVIFKGNKAVGVEYIYNNGDEQKIEKAYGKKIILCSGGINTPALLQRSGVGDKNLLNSFGIKVIVDNPNVGTLQNQYGAGAVVSVPTNATPFLQGSVSGSSSTPFNPPFNYPNDETRRLQMVGLNIGSGLSQVFVFLMDPKSKGSVNIVSRNPLIPPLVDLNLYSDGTVEDHGSDANLIVTGYYLIAESVGIGNMIFPPPNHFGLSPGTVSQDKALFQDATNPASLVAQSHYLGTCRMGTSSLNGVVDSKLRVFGTENLIVADLSVAPITPDGNTAYAAYVIGLAASVLLGVPVPPAL